MDMPQVDYAKNMFCSLWSTHVGMLMMQIGTPSNTSKWSINAIIMKR